MKDLISNLTLLKSHNEMQAKATDPGNEPPSMLWGLDPIFSAFARLYVRDILDMVESTQVPGNFHNLLQTMSSLFDLY